MSVFASLSLSTASTRALASKSDARLQRSELAERGAAGLFGRFHVDIFLRHHEAVPGGVFLEKLQLRRDREALLLLRAPARIASSTT
jgi:hypothetical protein